jgi:hypothetical protein
MNTSIIFTNASINIKSENSNSFNFYRWLKNVNASDRKDLSLIQLYRFICLAYSTEMNVRSYFPYPKNYANNN